MASPLPTSSNNLNPRNYTIQQLDDILLKITLPFLMSHWKKPGVGIVAATLIDKDNKQVTTTSTQQGDQYKHAERNAFEKFVETFGRPPSEDAIFIITLSPCVQRMAERVGESCTELMINNKLNRAHYGYLDTFHKFNSNDYANIGITATQTQHKICLKVCANIAKLFNYPEEIKKDLLKLKEQHEDTFLEMRAYSSGVAHFKIKKPVDEMKSDATLLAPSTKKIYSRL